MAGAFEGYMSGVSRNIIAAKEQAHQDEMNHLQTQMAVFSKLSADPDIQNDPNARAHLMDLILHNAQGGAYQQKQKRDQQVQKDGHPGHFHILGHLLATLGGAAKTGLGGNIGPRQLADPDMGHTAGPDLTSSSPQSTAAIQGDRLITTPGMGTERKLAVPGEGIYGAFKTPEQRQEAAQALSGQQADAERQQKLKDLQLAGVDPKSQEGQNYILGFSRSRIGTEPDDAVLKLRTKWADTQNLTGDARTEYLLTGKLPTGFGKVEATKPPTTTQIALDAEAQRLGKTPDKLTGAEKVAAVQHFREATKTGKAPAGKAGVIASGLSKASGYKPGGPSIANPGGKDGYVELAAWEWILNDKLPFTGMGGGQKGAPNKRELAIARAGEILQDLGISPEELMGVRGQLRANVTSLQQITKMGSMMSQFEETAQLNMGLAKTLSDKYARSGSPLVNQLVGGIMQKSGNADVNNFLIQMRTLATEYAKIMSGATSATGSRIADTEEATRMINGFLGKGQLEGLFQVMQKDIANRQQSVNDEKAGLLNQIRTPMAGFGGQGGSKTDGGGASSGKPTLPKPSQKGALISKAQAAQYIAAFGGPTHAKEAIDAAVKDGWRVK